MERLKRTEIIMGEDGLAGLRNSKVLIIGLGGVGSFAAEAIARSGIGNITVMDGDVIDVTNINRQLIAYQNNIGTKKASAMENRIKEISEEIKVTGICDFYNKDFEIDLKEYDYVIDAIDSVEDKLDLIENCYKNNVKIISSMGTAGKIRNDMFQLADISETSVCPLAKKIRKELKKRDIEHLKVVYSKEKALTQNGILGSMSYVPGVAGLIMAGEVIRDLGGLKIV